MTSRSRAIHSQGQEIVKDVKILAQTFLNSESTCYFKGILASIYDRKFAVRRSDTIHDILRYLSLAQCLLKGRNTPIWRKGNRGVNLRF